MEKERPPQGDKTNNADSQISPLVKAVHAHLEMEETLVRERQEAFEMKQQLPSGRIKALGKIVFEKIKAQLPGRKLQI